MHATSHSVLYAISLRFCVISNLLCSLVLMDPHCCVLIHPCVLFHLLRHFCYACNPGFGKPTTCVLCCGDAQCTWSSDAQRRIIRTEPRI